ncbi:chitinase-3-like protein 1 [Diorhabda sublineata]|uniref:chitinase-3-like protein 1 n=1 Tax=Diorhabda sublineata TaxID=1163346 RepID=UPI0024E0567C|nr:chitinase-3-like protein 1 [Diorhabda sublineata]
MRLQILLCASCLIFSCWLISTATSYNLVCYFASWAIYRNFSGKFDISDIDPHLCTHVCFAFIELYEDGSLYVVDPWASNDEDDGGHYHQFRSLAELKKSNPDLKLLLSLGGWNEGSKNFSIVSADPVRRIKLINEILPLIEKYNFDGLDVDWEYPTLRDYAQPEDKDNFVALLKDFSEVLKPKKLLLTAAVAGAVDKIESAYDVEKIMQYLDMINLMTYDYHGAFDNFVGHISPLHASPLDYEHGRNATYTVSTGLEYWIYKNADISKINMGVPTYARTFTLEDPNNHDLYAPVTGPGERGLYTGLLGCLGYHEVCEFYSGSDSVMYWDDDQKVPHRVIGDQWIGYDDEKSIELKVDFAMAHGVAGIMVWTMDTDDFNGLCGNKYPLINTVKNRLTFHENKKKQKKIS